ncbi:MAG TPA: cation:proton antiporter [Chloroflexia bacterium]|nr:cation:proton antiporter [Chloroflexia bacterium]
MENIDLLVDLAFAMGAALIGGFLAHRLRQPVILGYLLAGILIGPYTPGPVTSVERVQTLANIGVALLMFALGTEFSLEALQKVRKVAVYGGLAQVALYIALGTLLGLGLGYALTEAIFLGGVIAISSSILMLKLLLASDEVESTAGRIALGTSIVQDISMVALIIILPSLAQGVGWELAWSAGAALLKGGAFLVGAYLLGTRLVPPLLAIVAHVGSRELFLLTIVAIAAGMATLGQLVGISFALGAFVGGLVVSESEFSSHVLDEIIPVRDIFATIFFVSIGMLIEPLFLLSHAGEVILLVTVILLGKFLIGAGVIRLFGYNAGVSARAALLLAQIGEFSFVLASVGLHGHAISESLYDLILAGALVTLILNPILVNSAAPIAAMFRTLSTPASVFASKFFGRAGAQSEEALNESAKVPDPLDELSNLKRHVIVCGYGRVGHEVSRALSRRGFPFVTIDFNHGKVEEAREEGYLLIQGDATSPPTLERAGIHSAKLLVVTLPDLPSVEQVIRVGKALNPRIRVLARTHDARFIPHLKRAGADEVIQPEFEAGLEMVRQSLRNYGVSSLETQSITGGRRLEHYRGRDDRNIAEDVF